MDFLDISMGRYYQTYTGKYYKEIPDAVDYLSNPDADEDEPAIPFDYEYVDTTSKTYKHLIGNLTESEGIVTAIKTREQHNWRVGSFVILMDGRLCTIISVAEDRTNTPREAGRLFTIPHGTEYILRLTEYENPRGLI